MTKHLMITGTRGIPAAHGGFETFAERLSLHLVQKGWRVSVFCQADNSQCVGFDKWHGVNRFLIPVSVRGALGTVVFDWKSTIIASCNADLVLTLGYNTAVFSIIYNFKKLPNVINMDGIEWKRRKWSWYKKIWLYFNEQIGGLISSLMVADHPEIKKHLSRGILANKPIVVIPYGADEIVYAPLDHLKSFSIDSNKYSLLVARPEPENQILEVVRAFSFKRRRSKLVILGNYTPADNVYHRSVLGAASDEVIFLGAIYDAKTLASLRYHTTLYIHGHTVGGTNPALVEALGASSPILAHDNIFNRWVAGDGAAYFIDERECCEKLDLLLSSPDLLELMRIASRKRFQADFRWEIVLAKYEQLLESLST